MFFISIYYRQFEPVSQTVAQAHKTSYSLIFITSCMRCARRERFKGSLVMAAVNSAARCVMDSHFEGQQNGTVDRLKKLYPAVNEEKTPLPRAWSPKEKYNLIGLSQNNLRVHYKGEQDLMIFKVPLAFLRVLPFGIEVCSP